MLNSRSPDPIDITPTFYTTNGEAVVGEPVQLQSAEIRFVPIDQLIPEGLRGQRKWGGLALSFTGGVMELWAQVTFHGVGGGSVDETFNILEEPGSDTREAVWWMPKRSTAIIALGNSSDTAIHTTAQFSDGDSEEIDIAPYATKFLRRRSREREEETSRNESVKLIAVGREGSLRVAGFVVADDQSFTSSIRFYDTRRTIQPNLYATNLRLENTIPRMVLKNTGDVEVSARPRFFSAAGEQATPVELPTVTLSPQQMVDVDLSPLREAAALRPDLNSVSAQFLNSGAPGSLIGAAYSTERTTQMTYDVPLRDSGKNRNGTGSYPWRIDDDYSTIVAITNFGNQPARFQVEIRYSGGPYSIKPRELAAGETATFDLRQMRDQQQPDRLGKTLPAAIERGQFHWSVVATPGEARIIGRAEVVSRSGRVTSSYSCPTCCPDSGPYGGFDPNSYTVLIDGLTTTGSSGEYQDCYGYWYPSNIWWTSLGTVDTSIATVNAGTAELHGEGMGYTYANGTWDQIVYWTDNMDCYQQNYAMEDNAPVAVPSVNISNINIDTDDIATTLGPSGASGMFTLTWVGSGSSFTLVQQNRSAGSYSDSFQIANLPNGATYTSLRATWLVNGQTGSATQDYKMTVLGDYTNTCYITALESDFGGATVTAGTATSSCAWSSRNFVASFLDSVNLNGSGVDSSNTSIQIEGFCGGAPGSSPAYNGKRYRRPTNITTSCGDSPTVNLTVAASSLACGIPIFINTIGRRTVQDTGGGLAADQIDNYMGVGRSRCLGWSNNRRKTVQLY